MPVLSDEDVGLGSSYLTDEDVGLGAPQDTGGETLSPEELAMDEKKADELAAMKAARKTGRFSANAATAFDALGQAVEPFAVTPQNPLGAFGTAAGGLGKIAEYTGQVGKGIAQDVRLGTITGAPNTFRALSTGSATELDPTALSSRVIEGAGQGIGEMAPAIAATAIGIPPTIAYPTVMGSRTYQETGGDIPKTAVSALMGRYLPEFSNFGKSVVSKAIVSSTRYAPTLASSPLISKSLEAMGGQVAMNTVMGIAEAPELLKLYREDPNKFYDKAAEMIGVNLAMGAHDIMGIADPRVRSESGQEIADLIRPKMPEMFQKFTPPERGGIPNPADIASSKRETFRETQIEADPITLASKQVESIQSEFGVSKERATEILIDANRNAGNAEINRQINPQLEERGLSNAIQERKTATVPLGETPGDSGKVGAGTEAQTQALTQEGNAPQEPSPVLLDKNKWTKATDTENLKAATPEERTAAAQKPLDVESFTTTDADGYKAVDHGKLRAAVEGGHITSGNAATDALILHLLKPDPNHPLESIRMLDHTPEAAQLLSGTEAPFHGRWSKRGNNRAAMVEMVMKMQRGQPISSAEFMIVLGHELGHNAITSKFRDAPPEIQRDVTDLFTFVSEKAKGTAFENHNALTNAHELFAELSDPKFREWLSTLDYSGSIRQVDVGIAKVPAIAPRSVRNSALGRIYGIMKEMLKLPDFITDAFGNKVDTITALDQMVSLSSRLEKVQRSGGDTQVFTENLNRATDDGLWKSKLRSEYEKRIKRGMSHEKASKAAAEEVELYEPDSPQLFDTTPGVEIDTKSLATELAEADFAKGKWLKPDQGSAYFKPSGESLLSESGALWHDDGMIDVQHVSPQSLHDIATKDSAKVLEMMGEDAGLKWLAKAAKLKSPERKLKPEIASSLRAPESKDFKSAIKEAEKVPNEELLKAKGGPTGAMWDLGAKAKTPEDVAALKQAAEDSKAKVTALAKEGKIEEAMAVAGRQPAEAYEFATGVKLDGTPKWETFEKRRPGYVPPVPDVKYLEAKGGAAKVEAPAASEKSGLKEDATATTSQQVESSPAKAQNSAQAAGLENKGFEAANSPEGKSKYTPAVRQSDGSVATGKSHDTIPGNKGQRGYVDSNGNFLTLTDVARAEASKGPEKWTSATEEAPAKSETGIGGQMYAGIPNPVAVYRGIKQAVADFGPSVKAAGKVVSDAVRDIYKENLSIRKMGDLDRSVLKWSAKLQRSFGEASNAQKEVQSIAKDPVRDAALTNWLEAGGGRKSANDVQNKLVWWRNQATDPKLKAGYEAALNLTPAETALGQQVRAAYDVLGQRGSAFDVLKNFRDDYVTHIWDLGKGAFAGGARTLKDQFKYAKARTFDTFFDGEQAGMKPKTKRLSQLLPVYLHEMNSVIAARQLVKEMSAGKASDGRPLLAPQGIAEAVSGPKGEAVLVRPEAAKGDTKDYKELPGQPVLHDWVWAGKDTKGNPIFEKSDLVLHPEAYKKLKAILGKSKIKEWYETKTSATMEIPKAIMRGLDMYQSETKRTMFGLLSPFHQVQESWHGVGHRVLPSPVTGGDNLKAGALRLPKPDMDNPEIYDMAKHGLMILPDRASEAHFMEGLRPSGLVSFIPGLGKLSDGYSKYLFHEVIPGLKIKTYAAALERNKGVYEKQLASGEVNLEDVKLLTATQVNAAYGHLNYADFGRDPTIQHILSLGLVAPDFLEARMKFFGQALKGLVPELGPEGNRIAGARGNKVGREQLYALATLAAAQALVAYTSSKLIDGEWDAKHPFEVRKGNRKYTLRSVPEDAQRFWEDIKNIFSGKGGDIPFVSNRLNPITAKLPFELAFGREMGGRKITRGEALKHAATAPVPLPAKGFLGIDKSNINEWEQLAGSAGMKIMFYSPQNEVHKMLLDFKKGSGNAKWVAQAEQAEAETFAPSAYSDLRQAMEKDNFQLGAKAYEELLESHSAKDIRRAMNPSSVDPATGAVRDRMLPKALESQFLGSLSEKDREVYEAAKRQRRLLYQRFQKMLQE